jgi:hypothetical protein
MSWDKRNAKRIHFEHEYRATLLGVDGTWRRECIGATFDDSLIAP